MSTNKSIVKSAGVIGLATTLSRILGFIRDIVIARFFGTGSIAQAFVVAFRIPNLLRDLVGEGATNAAFVPVFTEELTKKGKGDFFRLAQVVLNLMFLALLTLTILGIIFSPAIVRLIAPGFFADKEKFQLTITLTRIMFPFLLLVGLWAFAMGALNTMGHFATPAFGSCALNLMMIICAAWFGENVFGLTSGVLIGGTIQLLMQFPPLYMRGWRFRLTRAFRHPQAKRIGILLIPRALGTCAYQVNIFVSTALASLSSIVGEGGVAAIYYANRVWQLPLAIFGIALAQAALPTMSRHVSLNDMGKLKDTLLFSLRILFFVLIPSSVGLMVLGRPITKVLFERGAFTAYSTSITQDALFFYAIGLVACGGVKVLVNAFYSINDTRTPVKIAVVSVVLNIVLNAILMWPLKLGGLALAASISAIVNFAALFIMLEKRLGDFGIKQLVDSFVRVSLASVAMAIILQILSSKYTHITVFGLSVMILSGLAVFILAAVLFRVNEMKEIVVWITRKR